MVWRWRSRSFNALRFYDFACLWFHIHLILTLALTLLFLSRCTKWKERSYITLTEEGNEWWWRRSVGWMVRRQWRELNRTPGWCILLPFCLALFARCLRCLNVSVCFFISFWLPWWWFIWEPSISFFPLLLVSLLLAILWRLDVLVACWYVAFECSFCWTITLYAWLLFYCPVMNLFWGPVWVGYDLSLKQIDSFLGPWWVWICSGRFGCLSGFWNFSRLMLLSLSAGFWLLMILLVFDG